MKNSERTTPPERPFNDFSLVTFWTYNKTSTKLILLHWFRHNVQGQKKVTYYDLEMDLFFEEILPGGTYFIVDVKGMRIEIFMDKESRPLLVN